MQNKGVNFAETYRALGDESRLRILFCLSRGMLNVQELTSILGLSQPTISHHLKVLQQNHFVQSHREGTSTFFALRSNDEGHFSSHVLESFLTAVGSLNGAFSRSPFGRDAESLQRILDGRREQSRQFFERVAPEWRALQDEAQGTGTYIDRLANLVRPEETLLELGCGSGNFLQSVLPRPGTTVAVDYSQAMLDEARRELGTKATQVDLRLGYLEHLPVADATVDTAVSHMVLHHLAHPAEVLSELARVLRPGGRVCIVDLKKHDDEYMRERYADVWLGFEPTQLTGWFEGAGFSVQQFEELPPSRAAGKDAFLCIAELQTKRKTQERNAV